CLAATLLMALVGPRYFPGDGAESRFEIAEAHTLRAQRPLGEDALPLLEGGPREALSDALCSWLNPDPARRPSISGMARELGVLLEQEREEARLEARKLVRQKTVRRVAFGALLLVIGVGGLIGYSK